ncbi:hypothetical protein T03_8624 [Trichinella britovi]|uniref:Uncharacterized protein n=1 Tax=Trichinella britovi TaxID=45882 RepID=A0A0V1DED6_TRIBR|nr:hypothetical protein T03_8624 [Trichinella britovi]
MPCLSISCSCFSMKPGKSSGIRLGGTLTGDPTVQIRCSMTLVNPGVVRKIFLKEDTMFWYVSAQLGRSRCWDCRFEFGMAHMQASSSWSEFSLSDSFPTPHDCAGLSASI